MTTENYKLPVVWLQLTAGQGPKECGWVVAQLLPKILQAASDSQLNAELVETLAYDKLLRKQDIIEPDAFLSVLIRLEGKNAKSFAAQWEGTIKWQGESPYRSKHKRINWLIGIAKVHIPIKTDISMDKLFNEVEIESMRAKGPGGQHVNKTNSAVRVTHRLTGIQVRVDTDRSQHRNKQLAMERLQLILSQQQGQQNQQLERSRWLQHYEVQRGNPIRTFNGSEFTEIHNP